MHLGGNKESPNWDLKAAQEEEKHAYIPIIGNLGNYPGIAKS